MIIQKQYKSIKSLKKILITLIALTLVFACSKKDAVKKTSLFEAESVFQQANDKIKKGRYEDAREILESIITQDTSGKFSPLARIRIGDTYFEDEQYEEAAAEYRHFLQIHPHHKYSSYTQYQLAMSYFKQIGTVDVSYSFARKALDEFEQLLKIYPRNPYLSVVENRIKACKNILAEYEFYVGKFYFKKGSYGAAAGRFSHLIQNYPDSKKELESLYYLGLSYNEIGDKDKSLKALKTLIDKYPDTRLSREAKETIASFNEKEK